MVDVVVNIGNARDVEDWENELPRAFLVDCLRVAGKDRVVPFENRGVLEAWLEEKCERVCKEWHVHDHVEHEEGAAESETDSDQSSEEVPSPPYYPLEEIKHTWTRY